MAVSWDSVCSVPVPVVGALQTKALSVIIAKVP